MRKKRLAKKTPAGAANAFGLGLVTGTTGNTIVSTGSGLTWGNMSSGNKIMFPNYTYPSSGNFQPIGALGNFSFAPAPARLCARCGTAAGQQTDPNEPPFVCGICKYGDRWDRRFQGVEVILERLVAVIERLEGRV